MKQWNSWHCFVIFTYWLVWRSSGTWRTWGLREEKSKKPGDVEDDFDSTEDGEASEKAHCASNQAQLGFHCHLYHVWVLKEYLEMRWKQGNYFYVLNLSLSGTHLPPSRPSRSHHRLMYRRRYTLPPVVNAPSKILKTYEHDEFQHIL